MVVVATVVVGRIVLFGAWLCLLKTRFVFLFWAMVNGRAMVLTGFTFVKVQNPAALYSDFQEYILQRPIWCKG